MCAGSRVAAAGGKIPASGQRLPRLESAGQFDDTRLRV